MMRIDGSYLYQVGNQIHPIIELPNDVTFRDAYLPVITAEGALDTLLNRSIYRPTTSALVGQTFLNTLQFVKGEIEKENDFSKQLQPLHLYHLRDAALKFETVFQAELSSSDTYLVTSKRGYVTKALVENGPILFPDDLPLKVPDALSDIAQGTRCVAFELPTAAAFHLHRANESVLRAYFKALAPNEKVPGKGAMGDFITRLGPPPNGLGVGDPKILACLRDLKDFHRNPVVHPEEVVATVDEALALLNNIHTAIVYMLKAIPMPPAPAAKPTAVQPA